MEKDWTTQQVETMPVIALRGLTIFPNVLIHFDGRSPSKPWRRP
jgi:ATP-dependent Lon protease